MDEDLYALGAKYYDGAYQNNPSINDLLFYSMLLQPPGEEIFDFQWRSPDEPGYVVRRYFRRTRVDFLRQYFEGEFSYRTFGGTLWNEPAFHEMLTGTE